jgi:hypothetical protein
VFGTLTIFLFGFLLTVLLKKMPPRQRHEGSPGTQ